MLQSGTDPETYASNYSSIRRSLPVFTSFLVCALFLLNHKLLNHALHPLLTLLNYLSCAPLARHRELIRHQRGRPHEPYFLSPEPC